MTKTGRFVLMTMLMIVTAAVLPLASSTEAQTQTIMPTRAKVVDGLVLTVEVKNPDGIGQGSRGFGFNSTCDIGPRSEYIALAQHDGMVLVELDFNSTGFALGERACPTGTLFWRSEQQFRMAAQEYRRHAEQAKTSAAERELIRGLLPRRTAENR